jgi:hypothetical protein
MVKTIDELMLLYQEYSDPIGKINREVKKDNLIPLVKGLYEDDRKTPGHFLSSYIYGPSYLSFEYALSFYGLIPEKVNVYTSATFNKRRRKIYQNNFGVFTYRDIPKDAYPYEIKVYVVEGYSYFMAIPEKAICDKLYTLPPQKSIKGLKFLIFSDLRIDEDAFYHLDFNKIIFLCKKYKSSNMKLLLKLIQKEAGKNDRS